MQVKSISLGTNDKYLINVQYLVDSIATILVFLFHVFPLDILLSVLCITDLKGITRKTWEIINHGVVTLVI